MWPFTIKQKDPFSPELMKRIDELLNNGESLLVKNRVKISSPKIIIKEVGGLALEEDRDNNFRSGHSCPDLEPHHREKLEFSLSFSQGSGLGTNTYIRCERCGCMQDITDYGAW